MNKKYATQMKLTAREAEVLELIIGDYTTAEIADKLNVTSEIVSAYKRNMLFKLDIRNVFEMANVSISNNLFSSNRKFG